MQMDFREHSRKMKAMNVRESKKNTRRVSGSGGSDDDDDDDNDWGIRVEAPLHFSCKVSFYSRALRMYTGFW